jgi:uncharacterized protein HemX
METQTEPEPSQVNQYVSLMYMMTFVMFQNQQIMERQNEAAPQTSVADAAEIARLNRMVKEQAQQIERMKRVIQSQGRELDSLRNEFVGDEKERKSPTPPG